MRGRKRHRKKAARKAEKRRRPKIHAMRIGFTFNLGRGLARGYFRPDPFDVALQGLAKAAAMSARSMQIAQVVVTTGWPRRSVSALFDELEISGVPPAEITRVASEVIRARVAGIPIDPSLIGKFYTAKLPIPPEEPPKSTAE